MSERRKCITQHCRNRARSGRRKCYKCQKRVWRAANPMADAYAKLRDHAKERGVEFTLTLAHFKKLATLSGYITGSGLHGSALTVDRINNLLGYIPGNVQVLTRSENSVKQAKYDAKRMTEGYLKRYR